MLKELDGGYAEVKHSFSTVDPNWIDKFMQSIFAREYDEAREVLRRAVASGVGKGVAEQYASVLEDFFRKRDEVEQPIILDRKGVCEVREIDEKTGRGLVVPKYMNYADKLYDERPLMYIQSPCSKKAALVCFACLVPVGSLATQLRHMGIESIAGTDTLVPVSGKGDVFPCPGAGCGAVFCSEQCRAWALDESPHAELCNGRLSEERQGALRELEQLAETSEQEHLLLLAHGVAQMLLRLRRGEQLEDVLHRYARQFVSRPWDDEGLPELSGETQEERQHLISRVEALLKILFGGDHLAEPLLRTELLSGLLGTFELVNMCISIPHPLNDLGKQLSDMLEPEVLSRIAKLQDGIDNDSDSEDGDEHVASEVDAQVARETEEKLAVDAALAGELFANVIGTALVETLAFTNHSCLPNCRIDFATSATGEVDSTAREPGLWVFAKARRPLMPGDEVLMCYVPSVIGKPLEFRQQRMKKFGFPCRCRCCLTDELLAADGEER